MDDRVSRGAARWATLVAVPLALLAGFGAFVVLGGFDGGPGRSDGPGGSGTTPRAGNGAVSRGANGAVSPGANGAVSRGANGAVSPGATGTVELPAPALAPRAEVVCRALLSRLPDALRDRARRPVSAGAEQNGAYGDPPITLACGAAPASFPATDLVYALDGVCWHAAETPDTTVWTTVDREVPVRVTVPRAYQEPGQWVIEFSGPVVAAVPSIKNIPAGCNP